MKLFIVISIVALLVLLFASYRKPNNEKKSNLPQLPKEDATLENNYTNIIFEGLGKRTKRLYRINVHFYPEQEKCILIFEGDAYELKRYQVGSEYEYRNDKGIFRVKGDEATITFLKGWELHLKAIPNSLIK